jgi:hypothetical protein
MATSEVHVWAVPLNGDPEPFAELLSADERERLGRYRFADHQRRYQIGHGALRLILAGYLDVAATDIEFRTGPRGKPYLVSEALQFNLSHSGKLALIAVARRSAKDCRWPWTRSRSACAKTRSSWRATMAAKTRQTGRCWTCHRDLSLSARLRCAPSSRS